MLSVEAELHLTFTVAGRGIGVNDLAAWCFELRKDLGQQVLSTTLWDMQSTHWERVARGEAELVCKRCGVVHSGGVSLLRRGTRARALRTSSGVVRFRLLQVTCSDCRATWSPYPELLGLEPRQRVSEELLRRLCAGVTELSFAKTTRLGQEWLGASVSPRRLHREVQDRGQAVEFTEAPDFQVLLADATKVPAGEKERGEEACVALQLQERGMRNGRPSVCKRVVGFSVGPDCWQDALATQNAPKLIVTDGEQGLRALVKEYYPETRHQQCEWHVPHTLKHMLGLEGMGVQARSKLAQELGTILKGGGTQAQKRYAAFSERLREYPRTQMLLRNAAPYVLYAEPSAMRTTSLAEREMRELNRRTNVGVRWSVQGITNLLRLRLARRHNLDDYARVWRTPAPLSWTLMSRA